jgi:hypothetical protein
MANPEQRIGLDRTMQRRARQKSSGAKGNHMKLLHLAGNGNEPEARNSLILRILFR